MSNIKISSKVDEAVWEELKIAAHESHRNISGMVNEAITEYLQRRRVRPVVLSHLETLCGKMKSWVTYWQNEESFPDIG